MPVEVVLTQDSQQWQQAVIVRYASRDAFLNIFPLNPSADDALIHKQAGVEETLVYISEQRHSSPPEPVSGSMFNLRYCEILLVTFGAPVTIEVWGTQGLNSCPQEQWDAIDPASITAEFGATLALKNSPRYFVVDWISNTQGLATGEPAPFGDIEMQLLTTIEPPEDAVAQGAAAYRITRVNRSNVWHLLQVGACMN